MENDEFIQIGTKFYSTGKHKRICTVIDVLKTYNYKGELVRLRYVATLDFMGHTVTDRDVLPVTIVRNLIKE